MNEQTPLQRLHEESKSIVAKWEKTGLLDGLANEIEKSNMAVLLEQQAKLLIVDDSGTPVTTIIELPLVRRVFAEMDAKELMNHESHNA